MTVTTGFGPNTYGCHEALHMAYVLESMIDTYLCHHPAVMLNAKWRGKADAARALVMELYQDIGSEHV